MEKNDKYFYIGGIISLLIYVLLLWFIFSYISKYEEKSKQYTSKKNSFIEISIKEHKNKKSNNKIPKKQVKKKKISKKKSGKKKSIKPKVKKSAKRTIHTKSLKSLFSGINTKKYLKTEQNLTKKANINSRIPKRVKRISEQTEPRQEKTASSIVKSLSLEEADQTKSQKSGEYNEYIGKISDMLDSKWQETPGTLPGNSAKVTVTIDKFGNFSYTIDELSYNNEFNAKLESFLESLKDETFPPYKLGDHITIKVNFKDE